MSQNVFGQPRPTEPIQQVSAPVEAAAGGRRKPLLLGGAGLGAVALLGAAAMMLTSGGSDAELTGEVPSAARAAAAATPAPTATATEEPTVAVPALDEFGRNPFKAKIVEGTSAAGGASAQATDAASGPAATVSPDAAATAGDGTASGSAGAVASQSFLTVTFRGADTKTPVKGDFVFELNGPAGASSTTVVAGKALGESGTAASLTFLGVNSNGAARVQGSGETPYLLLQHSPVTLA